MAFYPNQLQAFSLNGAGVVIGDTSLTLKSMLDIDGNTLSMSDFGSVGYGTLEPGNNTLEEEISFTGLVNNANGTTTLTGIKSITFGTPFTETTGFSKTHAGSTTFVISNTSGYYTQFAVKQNDEVITGFWSVPSPLANANPATKEYVDNLVNGGDVTNIAIIVMGTAGETLIAGDIVYLKNDGKWWKADASVTGTTDLIQLGISQGAGVAAGPITDGVLIRGIDSNHSGLSTGTTYYLSDTAGGIASFAGTIARALGIAISSTQLLFDPDFFYIPTALQKAAFAGTAGTPSSVNPFATKTSLDLKANIKFGGTGADGALTSAAGATNFDLAGANVFIKNFSSISLTGTASVTFTNPHANGTIIIFKCTGDITMSSSANPTIDLRNLGATGGIAGAGAGSSGSDGSDGNTNFISLTRKGTGGIYAATQTAVSAGGAKLGNSLSLFATDVFVGAGAGGGGAARGDGSNYAGSGAGGGSVVTDGAVGTRTVVNPANGVGGAGGRGAGALYIECRGAYSVSSVINAAGTAGSAGSATSGSGGGGGGGGTIVALYNTLTGDTGTYTVTGGAGGASAGGDGQPGGAGGDGYSLRALNVEFP